MFGTNRCRRLDSRARLAFVAAISMTRRRARHWRYLAMRCEVVQTQKLFIDIGRFSILELNERIHVDLVLPIPWLGVPKSWWLFVCYAEFLCLSFIVYARTEKLIDPGRTLRVKIVTMEVVDRTIAEFPRYVVHCR